VDNGRLTYSAAWDQILNERIKLHLGFDHRAFTDDLSDSNEFEFDRSFRI